MQGLLPLLLLRLCVVLFFPDAEMRVAQIVVALLLKPDVLRRERLVEMLQRAFVILALKRRRAGVVTKPRVFRRLAGQPLEFTARLAELSMLVVLQRIAGRAEDVE